MNTLAEILKDSYSYQGIQNLEVFYDSLFFNLKIKDSSNNYNILLIEKIKFDYENENIERIRNSLSINFGNTGTDSPYYSNGNCFIKAFLDKGSKRVYIVGIRQMNNGNTIPVIYIYDINKHEILNIFPKQKDVDNFNSFSNYNFKTNSLPVCNLKNDNLYIIFQSGSGLDNYINSLSFKIKGSSCNLQNYESVKYSNTSDIEFINVDDDLLTYRVDDYYGSVKRIL